MRNVLFVILATGLVGCDATEPASSAKGHVTGQQDSQPRTQPLTVSIAADVSAGVPEDGAAISGGARLPGPAAEIVTLAESLLGTNDAVGRDDGEAATARAREAVRLAAEVIQSSIDGTAQRELYERALITLLKARVQIATHGSQEDIAALYADVRTLNETSPDSQEAAEGIYQIARFALAKSRQAQSGSLPWITEATTRAQEYASHTASARERAAPLLLAVGQSCEVMAAASGQLDVAGDLNGRAFDCYTTLVSRCAGSREESYAVAAIRRLTLPGTQLTQFAGPTLDGGFLTATGLRGQAVVIYFWNRDNQEFEHDVLPALQSCQQEFGADVRFAGVSLDADRDAVRQYVSARKVPGPQVFFHSEGHQGWNSPVARFWGISHSPMIWLIDATGAVRAVCVPPGQLVTQVARLMP